MFEDDLTHAKKRARVLDGSPVVTSRAYGFLEEVGSESSDRSDSEDVASLDSSTDWDGSEGMVDPDATPVPSEVDESDDDAQIWAELEAEVAAQIAAEDSRRVPPMPGLISDDSEQESEDCDSDSWAASSDESEWVTDSGEDESEWVTESGEDESDEDEHSEDSGASTDVEYSGLPSLVDPSEARVAFTGPPSLAEGSASESEGSLPELASDDSDSGSDDSEPAAVRRAGAPPPLLTDSSDDDAGDRVGRRSLRRHDVTRQPRAEREPAREQGVPALGRGGTGGRGSGGAGGAGGPGRGGRSVEDPAGPWEAACSRVATQEVAPSEVARVMAEARRAVTERMRADIAPWQPRYRRRAARAAAASPPRVRAVPAESVAAQVLQDESLMRELLAGLDGVSTDAAEVRAAICELKGEEPPGENSDEHPTEYDERHTAARYPPFSYRAAAIDDTQPSAQPMGTRPVPLPRHAVDASGVPVAQGGRGVGVRGGGGQGVAGMPETTAVPIALPEQALGPVPEAMMEALDDFLGGIPQSAMDFAIDYRQAQLRQMREPPTFLTNDETEVRSRVIGVSGLSSLHLAQHRITDSSRSSVQDEDYAFD